MENASKALIMAASVLLGVMIISIGVYLFSVYGEYSADAYAQMEEAQVNEFNTQFLKYYGSRLNEEINKLEPIMCTSHDIITLANLAKQNNINQELYEADLKKERVVNGTDYYIRIDVEANRNIEKWEEKTQIKFIQDNSIQNVKVTDVDGEYILDSNGKPKEEPQTKYYKCTEAKVSDITKRVYYMKFVEV